jgi:hypothetical protein
LCSKINFRATYVGVILALNVGYMEVEERWWMKVIQGAAYGLLGGEKFLKELEAD